MALSRPAAFLASGAALLFAAGGTLAAEEPSEAPGVAGAAAKTDRAGPTADKVDPRRFGKVADEAYGAFQRGLYVTALNLALPRARAGDPAAQTLAAEIYSRGLGIARDDRKAAEWYAKAAEQGDPAAEFQYALLLVDGSVVGKDMAKAYGLMKAAADAGNHLAEFNLAQMMLSREPGTANAVDAVVYYERAAEAGVPDAQYAMAEIYANGFGGRPVDAAEARRWLESAARLNFDTAQLELGTWLVEGRGGKSDPQAGFSWLRRAARGGNVAAQNRLAKLYRSGVGTDADPIAAGAWYVLAHRAGLVDPEMEDFMQGLTDEERKEAIGQANRLR